MRKPRLFLLVLLASGAAGCGSGDGGAASGAPRSVTISWAANHEAAVNTAGGGYVVYYSQSSGFEAGAPGVAAVEVPYVSGALAPTTASLQLPSGTYYFRAVAYSALGHDGSPAGAQSAASAELQVVVP